MTQNWTNRKDKDAEAALHYVGKLINKYGMELILEALLEHNNVAIAGAQAFGVADDCLLILESNLKHTLKEYKGRHNEFGK